MSTARTVAVFAIVIGCFAVLYPRIFHPFVLRIFGMQSKSSSEAAFQPPGPGRKPDIKRPDGDDIKNHIRPGPHPGLRASAEMRQQQQPAGGGRGMMGVILPMYAVGIVLYLIYTIVKVFSKRQEARNESESVSHNRGYNYDKRGDKFTFGDDFEAEEDYRDFIKKKEKQRELEKLLLKADERHVTEFEMRQLQKRLEETEAQMSRILQAMQCVSEKVETVSSDIPATNPQPNTQDNAPQTTGLDNTTEDNITQNSNDSTPDSFDVVSKTDSSSFSVISTPTDEESPEALWTSPENTKPVEPLNKTSEMESVDDDITVLSRENNITSNPEVENLSTVQEDILLGENLEETNTSVRLRKLGKET